VWAELTTLWQTALISVDLLWKRVFKVASAASLMAVATATGVLLVRIGNGFDIHRLVPGRPLILGGVEIPSPLGLLGHSDGDALTHAFIDAILGASALGDIGTWFPEDDPAYEGACSLEMLRKVTSAARERGLVVVSGDSVIICERPKLAPYFSEMRKSLAAAMGIVVDCLSVKAKTAEGLGAIGAGEAIAAQCVVLLD
jgi:2-C-methyl-D-erythritol 2,4-cyclodiphosphate synthase